MAMPENYPLVSAVDPGPEMTREYEQTIQRIGKTFAKDGKPKDDLVEEARKALERYTPEDCLERFGLGSGYSLAKEFYYETIGANAAVIVRVLETSGKPDEAKAFMIDLYERAFAVGFTRDKEGMVNRFDSRTFMPLRRHIDMDYLRAIGYAHPESAFLCVGDCQTVLIAEKVRDTLPLPGIDIASYQHSIQSLQASPLADLFNPAGYLFFVNAAADRIFLTDGRDAVLERMRGIVEFLQARKPQMSIFVTHVFFGMDNAERVFGAKREDIEDAVGPFSDEVAAVLSQAPNAKPINFQEICPLVPDLSPFRDKPDGGVILHFRFDIMDKVAERVCAYAKDLKPAK